MIQSRNAIADGMPDQERLRHGHCLQLLSIGFSKLVNRLEKEIRYRGMKLTCAGRNNIPPTIIKRRNADLLATVALNLGHWPNILRGFSDVLLQTHEVDLLTL